MAEEHNIAEQEELEHFHISDGDHINNSPESSTEENKRWRSIRIMYLTMFLSSLSFSIYMSSIWPYLQMVDRHATANFYGWVVAAYNIGQLIASPCFGFWANRRKNNKEPLVVCMGVNVLGNILFAYVESIPSNRGVILLTARAIIGIGSGNVAVVRSYVSGATETRDRTATMANVSLFQAIGFIFGPVIQSAMVPIGYPGPINLPGMHLNMYTLPAWLSAIVGGINIILLLLVFREHRVKRDDDIHYDIETNELDYKFDKIAVAASNFAFFATFFIFAVFETICPLLTMHMFSWAKPEAVLYNGIIFAVGGVIAIIIFCLVARLSKRIDERYFPIAGFVFVIIGFILYLPYGSMDPYHQISPTANYTNITSISNGNASRSFDMAVGILHTTTTESNDQAVGCPVEYAWCANASRLILPLFLIGTLLLLIGFALCQVTIYSIYSKILGPRPQGLMTGVLTAVGSSARLSGPIFVTGFYVGFGPMVTFSIMAVFPVIPIVVVVAVFKKLKPFTFNEDQHIADNNDQRDADLPQ